MLSEVSRSLKITIIGGSIPERSGDKLYNSCCVFGTDGNLLAKHRKVCIFSFSFGKSYKRNTLRRKMLFDTGLLSNYVHYIYYFS